MSDNICKTNLNLAAHCKIIMKQNPNTFVGFYYYDYGIQSNCSK